MKKTFIFDLSEILLQLEVEVIRHLIDLETLPQTRHTVQVLKEAWLMDRLDEMHLVTFHPHQLLRVSPRVLSAIKSLAMPTRLDRYLYQAVPLPAYCSSMLARLEIRYNDVYLYFT